jgi:hypothetical protein
MPDISQNEDSAFYKAAPQLQIPPDVQAQLQQYLQRQALSQAMAQRAFSQQPTQFTPGPYSRAVPQGGLQALLQGLTGYLGTKQAQEAQQGAAGVMGNYQKTLAQQLAQLQTGGFEAGLSSADPNVRTQAQAMQKRRDEINKAAGGYMSSGGDTRGAVNAVVGGAPQNYTPPTPLSPVVSQQPGVNGPITAVTNFDKHGIPTMNLDSRSNVNVNNSGELATTAALGKEVPDVLKTRQKDATDAQESILNASKMIELARDPQILAGAGSTPALFLASIGARFGITGPDAATKTQELLALQAKQTLAASTILKGAISDKEKPFLEAASSGSVNWTPETIQHLAALSIAQNHNKLVQAVQSWKGAASMPGAEQGAAMFPLPPINYNLPEGMDFQEKPGGFLAYGGIRQNPNPRPMAVPSAPKGSVQNPYTPEELKKLLGQ